MVVLAPVIAQLVANDGARALRHAIADPDRFPQIAHVRCAMASVTVWPKTGGGWQVTGESRDFSTQRDAVAAARRQLEGSGGEELVIKGPDGRIREQNTVGGADPRRSKG
jgi:uncharacterized protein DUF2188